MNDPHPTGDSSSADPAPHLSYSVPPPDHYPSAASYQPAYQHQQAAHDFGTGYDGYPSGYDGYPAGDTGAAYPGAGYPTAGYPGGGDAGAEAGYGNHQGYGYSQDAGQPAANGYGDPTGGYGDPGWATPEAFPTAVPPDQSGYGHPTGAATGQWGTAGWDSTGWDATGPDVTGPDASGWDGYGDPTSGWSAGGALQGDGLGAPSPDTGTWDSGDWSTTGTWESPGWQSTGASTSRGWSTNGWDTGDWDTGGWDPGEQPAGAAFAGEPTTGAWDTTSYTSAAYGTGSFALDPLDPLAPVDPLTPYDPLGSTAPAAGHDAAAPGPAGYVPAGPEHPWEPGGFDAFDPAHPTPTGHDAQVPDAFADLPGHGFPPDTGQSATTGYGYAAHPADALHPQPAHPEPAHFGPAHPDGPDGLDGLDDPFATDAPPRDEAPGGPVSARSAESATGPEDEDSDLTEHDDIPPDGHRPGGTPVRPRGGSRSRRRAATRPRRSALLTVAVPSAAVLGVSCVAAASVSDLGSNDDRAPQASQDTPPVQPAKANNKLDTQLSGLHRDANDFADRANRTQERIDLKERQEAERKRKEAEAARKEALRPKFALPVDQHGLSAYYGQSGVNWMSLHTGIDFPVDYGTPVMAATDGTVSTQWNPSYGNMVILTAPDGTETWYCHLDSAKIRSGSVQAGDTIAYSGNSGTSTGPHLHFEVRPGGGEPIDPLAWFRSHGLEPT